MLPAFGLLRPSTLEEAVSVCSDDRVPYCGGTELLLAMRAGLHHPEALVDVKAVPELSGIRVDGDQLIIGAVQRHADIAADPLVQEHVPMLASVEQAVGNARVRAQGSIGGNLCFAEPKSDIGTALIALQATVTLAGREGQRELTVEKFIAGPYWAAREPDELLVDVRIPLTRSGFTATYLKYQTMERPTLGVALAHDINAGWCRAVVGAVGEVPTVCTFGSVEEVDADAIAEQIDPTADLAGSERYKRHVTRVYVRRAVAALAAQEATR